MNTTFSFSRLVQLVRKQWVENARIYLFSVIALIGILGLVIIFWLTISDKDFKEESIYNIFIIGLYIAGGVFASMSFNMLGEKEKGTYWLSLPASNLEKLLCSVFYNLIIFSLVYGACFFLLKTLTVTYIQNMVAIKPSIYYFRRVDWNDNSGFADAIPFLIYAFFAVQAFYMLGSVYFYRYSYVFTTIVGIALLGMFIWYEINLQRYMFPEGFEWSGNYISKTLRHGGEINMKYQLSGIPIKILSFLVKFIWAPVFWIATWYRLKEKEI